MAVHFVRFSRAQRVRDAAAPARKIFVTQALLDQCIDNSDSSSFDDDELAMVLGHEVSHLILGHVSDSGTSPRLC